MNKITPTALIIKQMKDLLLNALNQLPDAVRGVKAVSCNLSGCCSFTVWFFRELAEPHLGSGPLHHVRENWCHFLSSLTIIIS